MSLTETRCAELAMEVDELTAHVKVTLQIQIKLPPPPLSSLLFLKLASYVGPAG